MSSHVDANPRIEQRFTDRLEGDATNVKSILLFSTKFMGQLFDRVNQCFRLKSYLFFDTCVHFICSYNAR